MSHPSIPAKNFQKRRPPAVVKPLSTLCVLLAAGSLCPRPGRAGDPMSAPTSRTEPALPTREEAHVRAQLLHAALHGSLHVMHRDFFRRDGSKAIPSASLNDVFKAIGGEWHITLRWLASQETAMSLDNEASDEFQRRALKAISAGEKEVTSVENGLFRYAGAIPLQNECLKCHVPNRTTLEVRFAALEVTMALRKPEPPK